MQPQQSFPLESSLSSTHLKSKFLELGEATKPKCSKNPLGAGARSMQQRGNLDRSQHITCMRCLRGPQYIACVCARLAEA